MKTAILTLAFATLFVQAITAQDRTTVTSTSSEISDNLDLKAVASIFGDSENLEDFERRLNDPKIQISNLDLNHDNQVDYLRVIESVDGNTHLIIVQSVLERDIYQDVATIEVERDSNNQVQVQVVGDVYMYGNNYIYEPVYVSSPVIYRTFWVSGYRPYFSGWYWNYYPTYYYAWRPYPIYRYRRNVHVHINTQHHYNYVNVRRSSRAAALYSTRRSNGYERQYPTRSFTYRNSDVRNRYELDQTRAVRNNGTRSGLTSNPSPRSNIRSQVASPRSNSDTRSQVSTTRSNSRAETVVPRSSSNTRTSTLDTRGEVPTPRSNSNAVQAPRSNTRTDAVPTRSNTNASVGSPRASTRSENMSVRSNSNSRAESPQSNQRAASSQRGNTHQSNAARRSDNSSRNSR